MLVCCVAVAALQAALSASSQRPSRGGDLAIALGARSTAMSEREDELQSARDALVVAVSGMSFTATLSPSATWERDLVPAGSGVEFDADLAVAGQLVYRYDQRALLTARLAVVRAEGRLTAQRRSDVERALLALSSLRLALRTAADAEAALRAARSEDAPENDLLTELELRSAALDLRAAEESVDAQRQALAELGVHAQGALSEIYFAVPQAQPEAHQQVAILRLQLSQAAAAVRAAEFAFLPTVELTGRYEESGVTASGRVALAAGRPEVALGVAYRPDDDRTWQVGIGATFRVRDTDLRSLAAAEASLLEASAAVEAFLASYDRRSRESLNAVAIAEEGFSIAMGLLALAHEGVARASGEVEMRRAQQALRRADDAAERAWQRYVRAMGDHLEVADGDWWVDEAEEE